MNTDNTDLDQCAQEPIHIPSAIQPHGFFLAVDPESERIIAASDNLDCFSPFSAQTILGKLLAAVFPDLSTWVQTSGATPLPALFTLSKKSGSGRFVVTLHRTHHYLTLEGEPAAPEDESPDHFAQSLIEEVIGLSAASSVEELCSLGARSIQRLSGFGRVMAYRFEEDFHGCVVAEAKSAQMDTYLHHHFPASDIPAQARELYRRNWIRYIADASYTPVALVSIAPEPVDMSDSHLRSVSPIHLEYLRNMDVASSMSLSIVINGELWGLFACHHISPTRLPAITRRYCENFIRVFNVLLQDKLNADVSHRFFRLKNHHDTLKEAFQTLCDPSGLLSAFQALGESWLHALDSDGVCMILEQETSSFGTVPSEVEIRTLSAMIDPLHTDGIYCSSSLAVDFPALRLSEPLTGAISLLVSDSPRCEILWFRQEWVRELTWAGNPDKTLQSDAALRISPRKSFEAFTVLQKGKSRPWTPSHLQILPLYKDFGPIIQLYTARQAMQRQDQLLIQQAKMAMMGEMIDAVAHQWSQPLNSLSLLISGLSYHADNGRIDVQQLQNIQQQGMDKIYFMVDTLDAFRNFFKSDQTVRSFSITQSIREVADLFMPQFKLLGVELIIDDDPALIIGPANEFKQIILSLLANANDALRDRKIPDPRIICRIERRPAELTLLISDNAGGIEESYLQKVFAPHFSTKEYGSGSGLYLARLIVEEHFGGTITVRNDEAGACFTLTFPTDPQIRKTQSPDSQTNHSH
ncbi:MAG: GAF domain-containing protein [Campylobacterales bacterium]|nr:GAF domain-containing protein [Campylobacterales bacterium]